jgi:hypothetical protein
LCAAFQTSAVELKNLRCDPFQFVGHTFAYMNIYVDKQSANVYAKMVIKRLQPNTLGENAYV